jgi:23S rRNA (adenine2503-C2)-methyltransferase
VGLIEGIERLAELELPITLAISLHAADEDLRRRLVPASGRTSLADLMEAARAFYHSRNREVTLEYVLLKGVNDTPACARDLSRLASGLRCNVNLIRYNPVASLEYAGPSQAQAEAFARRLEQQGVNVQVRRSRGLEADAACGQLRKRTCRNSGSCLGKASHRKET